MDLDDDHDHSDSENDVLPPRRSRARPRSRSSRLRHDTNDVSPSSTNQHSPPKKKKKKKNSKTIPASAELAEAKEEHKKMNPRYSCDGMTKSRRSRNKNMNDRDGSNEKKNCRPASAY